MVVYRGHLLLLGTFSSSYISTSPRATVSSIILVLLVSKRLPLEHTAGKVQEEAKGPRENQITMY